MTIDDDRTSDVQREDVQGEFPYLHHHARVEGRICPHSGLFVSPGHSLPGAPTRECTTPWDDHVRAVQVVNIYAASADVSGRHISGGGS